MNKKQYFGLQCFQTISHRYCIRYDIVIQLFGPANCKYRNSAICYMILAKMLDQSIKV